MDKRLRLKEILVSATFLFILMTGYVLAAPPTPEKPLVIDFECWLPPKDEGFQTNKKFFDGMAAVTKGAVKLQYHVAGAMGSGADSYTRVLSGISGAAQFGAGYTPGVFPMFMMFDYPSKFPTAEALTRAMIKMYELGYFDKDFAQVKVLGMYSIGPYIFVAAKNKVTKIEQLRGLKVRCPSEGWVNAVKALGATPVSMPSGEQYIAMQKGIIDITPNPWSGIGVYKLSEVARYVNEVSMMTFTHAIIMNKDKWNELPREAKEYLEKNWKQNSLNAAKLFDNAVGSHKETFLKQAGREIVHFETAEWDKMDKLFAPLWEKWISATEAKGLPAKKAANDLYKTLKELGVEKPLIGYTPR